MATDQATQSRDAIERAAHCWFNDTFDADMLRKMEAAGIIAQAQGFAAACIATIQAEMEAALGVEE